MRFAFEVLDGYEVVWDGGPLLPERDQKPDHRWNGIPQMIPLEEKYAETRRSKRVYTKRNLRYWNNRAGIPEVEPISQDPIAPRRLRTLPVSNRHLAPTSQPAVEGVGDGGQQVGTLQNLAENQEGATKAISACVHRT